MDYEFTTDLYGRPTARCSMGHEAISNWLSSEISNNGPRITAVLLAIQKLKLRQAWDVELEGAEFSLLLSQTEAQVLAHSLSASSEMSEDEMDFYDCESKARCGLDDFSALLADWSHFVGLPDSAT